MLRRKAMRKMALLMLPTMFISSVGNGVQVGAMVNATTQISENNSNKEISETDIDLEKLKEDGKRYLDNIVNGNSKRYLLGSDTDSLPEWLGMLCAKSVAGTAVKWAASKLLNMIISSDSNSKILSKMDRIISDVSYLRNQLGQIEDSIVDLTNINQLNEFLTKSWSAEGSMRTIYGAMRALDGNDDEKCQEKIIRERKELMAYGATGIPKQMLHGSLTDFDKEVMHYVDALRKQYIVSFGPKTAELFEIYHQHLKNKYHWEHQAYEEWRNFQEYCMITGIQSIWLDCLSLKARIEEIEDHNKQCQPSDKISTLILEERLKELDTILKDLKNMWDKNKIDERKPNERYFWTPKKEMLLLVAKDKYKECPRDDENYGINDFVMSPDPTDHGAYSEYYGSQADVQVYRMHVSIPFWKPFTMYDAKNNIRPLNDGEYKDILNAYNGKKSLYDIFFDESEGNMPAEFDTNASRKVFIVDGDAEYEKMTFKADRIYCRAVDAEECKFNPSNYIICYYHFSSSEPIDEGRYISVGVKKHGVCEHYSGYVNE